MLNFNSTPFAKSSAEPSLDKCIEECNMPPPSTATESTSTPRNDTSSFILFLALPWVLDFLHCLNHETSMLEQETIHS